MPKSIEALLGRADQSVRFPHSAMRIASLAGDARATNRHLAEQIEQDPAFAAKLLKLANSPAFGLPRSVLSIEDAIGQVGREMISDMAMVQGSATAFSHLESELMRATTFWKHSCEVATLARLLAQENGLDGGVAFIGGLLHDIGLLILFGEETVPMRQTLELSLDHGLDLDEAEAQIFGFDHAELGGALAGFWNLPEALREVIACHHHPERATSSLKETACVALANQADSAFAEPAEASSQVLIDLDEFGLTASQPLAALVATAKKTSHRLSAGH